MLTDIKQLLPTSIYQGLTAANTPSAGNPFATIADLSAGPTIYTGDGSLTGTRTVSLAGFNLYFDGIGDVGIGTVLPTAKLHVKGSTSDVTAYGLKVENSTGVFSLQVRNDGSVYNLGVGSIATNTAFGLTALGSNTTGFQNTAFGYQALIVNNIGAGNSAFGHLALAATTTGIVNSAFGDGALRANIGGTYNVAMGYVALNTNSAGDRNTSIGTQSMQVATSGSDNTAVGANASAGLLTGSFNTAVGSGAGGIGAAGAGVFIGYQAGLYETASNALYIHNSLGVSTLANGRTNSLIYGIFDSVAANQRLTFNGVIKLGVANGTAANTVVLGTNSTAAAGSPYTWIDIYAADGTLCAIPLWAK